MAMQMNVCQRHESRLQFLSVFRGHTADNISNLPLHFLTVASFLQQEIGIAEAFHVVRQQSDYIRLPVRCSGNILEYPCYMIIDVSRPQTRLQ